MEVGGYSLGGLVGRRRRFLGLVLIVVGVVVVSSGPESVQRPRGLPRRSEAPAPRAKISKPVSSRWRRWGVGIVCALAPVFIKAWPTCRSIFRSCAWVSDTHFSAALSERCHSDSRFDTMCRRTASGGMERGGRSRIRRRRTWGVAPRRATNMRRVRRMKTAFACRGVSFLVTSRVSLISSL